VPIVQQDPAAIVDQRRLEAEAESKIAAILAKAIGRGGAPRPPEAVRQIIEGSKSEELEDVYSLPRATAGE
jgi:hypothetical protein